MDPSSYGQCLIGGLTKDLANLDTKTKVLEDAHADTDQDIEQLS